MRADRVVEGVREERPKAPPRAAARAPEMVARALTPANLLHLATGASNSVVARLVENGRAAAPASGGAAAAPGPDDVQPEDTQGPPGAPGPPLPAARKRAVAPKPP